MVRSQIHRVSGGRLLSSELSCSSWAPQGFRPQHTAYVQHSTHELWRDLWPWQKSHDLLAHLLRTTASISFTWIAYSQGKNSMCLVPRWANTQSHGCLASPQIDHCQVQRGVAGGSHDTGWGRRLGHGVKVHGFGGKTVTDSNQSSASPKLVILDQLINFL